MEFFKALISILAYAALGFSATAAYLKINKIWKRKHNAEVANSVSIAGNVIGLIPMMAFGLNFLLVAQWHGSESRGHKRKFVRRLLCYPRDATGPQCVPRRGCQSRV